MGVTIYAMTMLISGDHFTFEPHLKWQRLRKNGEASLVKVTENDAVYRSNTTVCS